MTDDEKRVEPTEEDWATARETLWGPGASDRQTARMAFALAAQRARLVEEHEKEMRALRVGADEVAKAGLDLLHRRDAVIEALEAKLDAAERALRCYERVPCPTPDHDYCARDALLAFRAAGREKAG